MLKKDFVLLQVTARDGVVRIEGHYDHSTFYFLGHTGSGHFNCTPGKRYHEITFAPTPGEQQTILLKDGDRLRPITITWQGDKAIPMDGTDLPISMGSSHFETMIRTSEEGKPVHYVTNNPSYLGLPPGTYRHVDHISLLQCLEGRITPLALARRAKKLAIKDPRDARIRELEEQVEGCLAKIADDQEHVDILRENIENFKTRLGEHAGQVMCLATLLRAIYPIVKATSGLMSSMWCGGKLRAAVARHKAPQDYDSLISELRVAIEEIERLS